MKKKIRKILPIVLFLIVFLGIIGALVKFYATGQLEPVTVQQMKDTLTAQGLQPMEITDNAQGNFPGAGLLDCIVVEQGDIRFEFYNFDNEKSALRVFREARKLIKAKMDVPRVIIETGKLNYQYYSLKAGGNYSVTVYVENTAIYAYCEEENQSKLVNILNTIGYVDAEPKQETPVWLMIVTQIFPFICFQLFIALPGRSFFWQAARISAGVTQKQVEDREQPRKELVPWLMEVSHRENLTKSILIIYRGYLLPGYVCIVLSFVSLFTSELDEVLNKAGVIFPMVYIPLALVGLLLSKYLKKK